MKKKTRFALSALAVLVLLAAVVFLINPFGGDEFAGLKAEDMNYILVTVDTLRVDRIATYGCPDVETPTMDLFASRGVKFTRCVAQTPLTLPSHTSIMSGTYPTFHGVRDNGGFLVPQEIQTLAEKFKGRGFETGAFVASYVLDSKWGLDQGFDHYFDRFDLSKYKTISLGNIQRPADEVLDQALSWMQSRQEKRTFAWIHLYDPHTPYDPPSPFKEQYGRRPYLGEVAFTDSQLARLWQYLEDNDLVDKTVLIFTSDHGESLGEHKESSHGFFIYQEGVHVPLIFVTPEEKFQGLVHSDVVGLVDIMPTMLDMAGIDIPSEVQGNSLLPAFSGKSLPESFSYSETFYPRFHYGWSELTSIQEGRYKLIIAPELELYDLTTDPEEQTNLVENLPQETRRLVSLAERFIEETGRDAYKLDYRHMDEDARQKLAALGYIGSFTDTSSLQGRRLGDPKEKIVIFNRLSEAREMGLGGEYQKGIAIVDEIIADDPDVIDAYFTKGNLFFKAGDFDQSLEAFFQALEKKPDDAFTIINIANSYVMKGDFNEAEKFLLSIKDTIPPDSQINLILGNINYAQKEYDQAEEYFRECVRLNESSASAYSALGGIYVIKGSLDEAERNLRKAEEFNPQLRNLHFNFAQLYEEKGDIAAAEQAYLEEMVNVPHNFRASYNLARLYRLQGNTAKEEEYLNITTESNPNFPLTYFYLARIYLNREENYPDAVRLVEKGIELKPEEQELPLGYFLLADLYNRLGESAKALEYAQKGKELADKYSQRRPL
jgi:arylsulfatase A-like enzyme/Flp pilus assembly protein TadD